MKTELLQNVKAQPYTSATAIDRIGFNSAVIAAAITTTGTLSITATHSDDGVTYVAVADENLYPEKPTTGGVYTCPVTADDLVNVDVDLSGLKRYVKFTITGAGTTALVLGDGIEQPV